MNIINDIIGNKIPEVPFKVTVDDKSILKIAVAAVIVSVIIILVNALVKK